MQVSRWQADAIAQLGPEVELFVYNCINTGGSSKKASHALYYALNLFTIRNEQTRKVPLSNTGLPIADRTDFTCDDEGAWQRLPKELLERIRSDAVELILKFGMSLLRVPPEDDLAAPILSYHHGDPRHYRGRPAGFYELLHKAPVMGQIVQILSNKLDAGQVVAFAETKIYPNSYRRTLQEAYSHSPLLLKQAMTRAVDRQCLDIAPEGRNYKLPPNGTVLRLLAGLIWASFKRLVYGACVEKGWHVSSIQAEPDQLLSSSGRDAIAGYIWKTEPTPSGYSFLADPFFDPFGKGLLVEALNKKTGLGEVGRLDHGTFTPLTEPRFHASYPAGFKWKDEHFLVPEVSEWSPPQIYRITIEGLQHLAVLDVLGAPRLLDPTLHVGEARVYLFGNRHDESAHVLRLWHAHSPFETFVEHPASPIRISPMGGRMAGSIFEVDSRLYRLGQDGCGDYGNGLVVYQIETLSPDHYKETEVGQLRFKAAKGPHTVNFREGRLIFDWYRERFTPSAGFRRLLGFLARR
jgi:hypothetical protein